MKILYYYKMLQLSQGKIQGTQQGNYSKSDKETKRIQQLNISLISNAVS